MTIYYEILEGNIIGRYTTDFHLTTGFANINETEEEFIRCEDKLMLKSTFDSYTQTEEYQISILKQKNEAEKINLLEKADELDKKRIRAIAEPSVKDQETGETWLEYYNQQVKTLREKLGELNDNKR